MITPDVIGFATLGGSIIAMVAFVLNNQRAEGQKRSRIYERFDEERDEVERVYVRKDVHNAKYDAIEKDVTEIKGDVKKLLTKNGLE